MKHTYTVDPPVVEVGGQKYQQSKSAYLEYWGPCIPVIIDNTPKVIEQLSIKGVVITPHKCTALIDTGASLCVISKSVAKQLQLNLETYTDASFVEGGAKLPTYAAIIKFEWGGSYYIPVIASETMDVTEFIIGRDILAYWDINYNGKDGVFTIDDNNSESLPEKINIFGRWILRHFKFFFLFKKSRKVKNS